MDANLSKPGDLPPFRKSGPHDGGRTPPDRDGMTKSSSAADFRADDCRRREPFMFLKVGKDGIFPLPLRHWREIFEKNSVLAERPLRVDFEWP